jgi:hypothetical protein
VVRSLIAPQTPHVAPDATGGGPVRCKTDRTARPRDEGGPVRLELSDEGADAFRELLAWSMVQPKGEIHDADSVTFRRTHTRETLETFKSRLSG